MLFIFGPKHEWDESKVDVTDCVEVVLKREFEGKKLKFIELDDRMLDLDFYSNYIEGDTDSIKESPLVYQSNEPYIEDIAIEFEIVEDRPQGEQGEEEFILRVSRVSKATQYYE